MGSATVRCTPNPGHSVPDQATFLDTISLARSEGFGEEVKKRVLLGTYAVTTEAWDSYYMAAFAARYELVKEVTALWKEEDLRAPTGSHAEGVDIMVHPTSIAGAPRICEGTASEYAPDVLTAWANLAGDPVISAPAASRLEGEDGAQLPMGISFAAQWGYDDLLLHVVDTVQKHGDALAPTS